MRIYLDNCCFNRPFDDQHQVRVRLETSAKLFIQERVLAGEFELAWSYILDCENAANPLAERREDVARWRDHCTEDVEESAEVLAEARELVRLGLRSEVGVEALSRQAMAARRGQ